jgi:pimeloyl-ACP methyl ester carboxylesterase
MGTRNRKSTIVRIRLVLAARSVRAAFWVLERWAPALGARWAERLWFTIPRARAAQRGSGNLRGRRGPGNPKGVPRSVGSRSIRPGGTGWDAGERFEVAVDGRPVVGRVWGEGEPVYLLHGWGGSAWQLGAFVAPLLRAGYRVVAFDAPSHGESAPGPGGPRGSTLLEFAAALRAVVVAFGPPRAVVSHSLGCSATATALRDGLAAGRVVFLAPMADPRPYTHDFARRLGFGERVRGRMVERIERRVGVPMSDFDLPAMARQMTTPPLLVVHDRDDREIRWTGGRDVSRAWPAARLLLTSGLGHRRILRDPEVVAQVVAFVRAGQEAAGRPAAAAGG